MTGPMGTFDLLGTPLLATTYEELIAHAQILARDGGTHAIDLTNTHIVTLRRHDAHSAKSPPSSTTSSPTTCPSSGA
ncbi:MAG: hypothetical protein ABI787_09180 [Spartobacteria bacterium]